jgi:lysosomal Pro-X carboxypeptidase
MGPVDSYLPGNIEKLTIEQAMADYVVIIDYVKQQWNITDDAVIIAFGGSYPGDLTVYMRAAYPDVIDAGLASSAPLRYHIGEIDNGAFYKVVTDVFATTDPNCPTLVRNAFIQIFELAQTQSGRDEITQKLNLCSPLAEGPAALKLLSLWVENAFATLGMADYPYPFMGMPPYPLEISCAIMDSYYDPIVGLGQAVGIFYNLTSTPLLTCFNITNEYYPCADITGCGGGVGDPDAMSWDYQSCTELVSNVDTNNMTDMFPSYPYDFPSLEEYCMTQWNAVPQPLAIPTKYNYTTLTNLILSNGRLDPWHPGGVLPEQCPPQLFCILIDEAAHHLDLRGTDPIHDPASVLIARQYEAQIIGNWILTIGQQKMEKLVLNK